MSFTDIEAKGGRGARLRNAVRLRVYGGGIQFLIARDVAERIGLIAGLRARVAVGSGDHEGWVRITPAPETDRGAYRVIKNGGSKSSPGCALVVAIGARHFGLDRKISMKSRDLSFSVANGGALLCELPRTMRRPTAIAA